MRFVTFRRAGSHPEAGVVRGDEVISLSGAGFPDSLSVIRDGPKRSRQIEAWCARPPAGAAVPLESVNLLAPIPRPPKFICVGLNYRDHAEETKMPIPTVPTIFAKFSTAVIGPGDSIVLPKSSTRPDYEAEFAFVIGQGGRHIAAADWRDHVFGYTIVNDVSARDYQMATTQWLMGKTFDTFAPMGPYLVTADEIADPHELEISLTLNGQVMQNSNTRNLIFRLPGADRVSLQRVHAGAGRRGLDRHARRRRLRAQAARVPAGRRRSRSPRRGTRESFATRFQTGEERQATACREEAQNLGCRWAIHLPRLHAPGRHARRLRLRVPAGPGAGDDLPERGLSAARDRRASCN